MTQQKRKKGTYFYNREPFRILRHSWIPTEVEVTREKVGPASWLCLGKSLNAFGYNVGKNVMWLPRLLRGGRNNAFYTNAFLAIRNNEFLKIQVNLRILSIWNNEFYLRTPMPNEFHQNRTTNSYILGLNHSRSKP